MSSYQEESTNCPQCLQSNCTVESCCLVEYECQNCQCRFSSHIDRRNHSCRPELIQSAIQNRFAVYRLKTYDDTSNFEGVLTGSIKRITECLEGYKKTYFPTIKFNLNARVIMTKFIYDYGDEKELWFDSKMSRILLSTDTKEAVTNHITDIVERIAKHVKDGSGWVVNLVPTIDIMITRYSPTTPNDIKPRQKLKKRKVVM